MSELGVKALQADREAVLEVARSLSDDEWAAASDCAGWRVQDVLTHMAAVLKQVADPGSLPTVPGKTEATQDAIVAERRDWTPAQVLEDYEDVSTRGIEALTGLQAPGIGDTEVDLDDLGRHPLSRLADAIAFDHYCHLRNDILAPNGPIERPVPPHDEVRLGATMAWLLAGLPQMAPDALRAAVTRPIVLRFDGPAGGKWTLEPAEGDGLVTVREGADPGAAATVVSTTPEFVVWSTRRRPWQERDVKIDGDEAYAATVLDAVHCF